jgi:uncharacterized DUF497 family protein
MRRFVWDEPKRLANLEKHGLLFEDVKDVDWETAVIEPARPDRFGRSRSKAIGRFRDGTVVVIYSELGSEGVSIISFRPANDKERQVLDDQTQSPH